MKPITLYLFALFNIMVLGGCSFNKPLPQLVTKVETVHIKVPENLLQPCLVTRPPNPIDYLEMDYEGKENELTNFSINLLKDLNICNSQIKQIKDFQTTIIKGD